MNRPPRQRGCVPQSDILSNSQELFGVEFEIEGGPWAPNVPMEWETVPDLSLRDGIELRLQAPVAAPAIEQTIRAGLDWCVRSSGRLSIRTGLHVHVDMSGATQEGMLRLLAAYLFFEPQIMRYVGADREALMFCQPLFKTQAVLQKLVTACREQDARKWHSLIPDNDLRYSALNFAALKRIGTVEWRHHAMSLDYAEVIRWLEIISSIHSVVDMPTTLVAQIIQGDRPQSLFGHNEHLFNEDGDKLSSLLVLGGGIVPERLARDPATWETILPESALAFKKGKK